MEQELLHSSATGGRPGVIDIAVTPDGIRDCRIEDACAQRGTSDVFLAYDHRLYVPFDGVDFGNLDIRQATAHAWFGWDREKLPVQGVPVDIVGRITVRMPDGGARTVALDAEGRKSLF